MRTVIFKKHRPSFVLGLIFVSIVMLCVGVFYYDYQRETGDTAFLRLVTEPMPRSVAIKEYWRAIGMGGDGTGVITFSIAQRDFVELMQRNGYRLLPHDDDGASLLLKLELEIVKQRTGRTNLVDPPYTHYGLSVGDLQKHFLVDTNDQAKAVFWFRTGPPI